MSTAAPAPAKKHVCLAGFGTAGDVHPLLGLGRALAAAGHRVTVLTNPVFGGLVESEGFGFAPVGTEADYEATVSHPKLWHPIDGLGVLWRYLLRPALEPTYRELARIAGQGPCVAAAAPVVMGARLAQEHAGVPLVTLYTAATMLRSTRAPMTIAQWDVPGWMPRMASGAAWRLLDRYKLEPLVAPALQDLRSRLGMPPLRRKVFADWMHSPQAGLALFPHWFVKAAPDWPPQMVQAGFPLWDEPQPQIPPALERFLAGGPAPVVFMPGTGRRDPSAFFGAALASCRRLGCRGVFLGRVPAAHAAGLPPSIHVEPYAPFGALLRRARALVHHGGAGSSAQGLRAGLPQVAVPLAYDQFDNGMRLEHLGVGRRLAIGHAGLAQMPAVLESLLASTEVARACAHWAPQASGEAARHGIVQAVEALA